MSEDLDMPHPLSRVCPKADISVTSGAISNRPQFTAQIMRVIATWAHIDGDLASILSRMLKADIATGTAMYMALSGGEARRAALLAAADRALPEWQNILLQAVLKASSASRQQRNNFAHHVWGMSNDLPDALLLTHPSNVVDFNISHRQRTEVFPDGRGVIAPKPLDYDQIFVYREADFKRAVNEANKAEMWFALLYGVIGRTTEQARRLLLIEPEVQQALRPLIQKSSPEVQAILRPPADGEPPPTGLYPQTW